MAKITANITVDPEVWEKAQERGINISGMLNDYLKALVLEESKDLDGVNLELLNLEIEKEQDVMKRHQIILQGKLEQKKALENKVKYDNEERLKLEAQKLEASKRCSICGELAVFKSHQIAKGVVCHACFMNPAYGQKIREMM